LGSVNPPAANGGFERNVIGVMIADGDNFARAGIRALLSTKRDIAVVGFAADGHEALALARQLKPDVIVLDIALSGIDAIELTKRLAADVSGTRVVILSVSEQDEVVFSSLRAGASGFLARDVEPAQLVKAIRTVAAGEAALSPRVVHRVIAELAWRAGPLQPGPAQLDELTRREREVMALVAAGLNNDEIAQRLVVAPATARTHVSRALSKLRVRDRAQLVTLAYETGLVRPRQPPAKPPGTLAPRFAA